MRIPPRTNRGFVARLFRRGFIRDEAGATAVEFAILAIPFFALVGAILETALVFLASQVLDSAVETSTRLIRTGQAQSSSMDASGFRSAICDNLFGMFDCNGLRINVKTLTTFNSAAVTPPIDPVTGKWKIVETYNAGASSSIEMVEVYYKWPVLLNFAGFNLADGGDQTRLLGAVRVFKNEPF